VSDRVQGGHQLPAACGRHVARRRAGGRRPGRVHDVQHDGHSGRVDAPVPQVRPDVPQTGVHPLVRERGYGEGRLHPGPRKHRSPTARLQGAGANARVYQDRIFGGR